MFSLTDTYNNSSRKIGTPFSPPETKGNITHSKTSKTNFYIQENDLTQKETVKEIRKVLYVGYNAKPICSEMLDLNNEGLALPTSFKAFCYLKHRSVSCGKPQATNLLPDAILCDQNLSDGDAITLFEQINRIPCLKNIPFIVLAKEEDPVFKQKALEAGIDDYYLAENLSATAIDQQITFLNTYKEALFTDNQKEPESFERVIPATKRAFDILVSSVAIILLSPIYLLIALLVTLDSKGPVFYISKRVGTGYHIFNFYKFRSMRAGADKELKDLMHLNQYRNGELVSDETSPEVNADTCLDCLVLGHTCSPIVVVDGKELCESFYNRSLKKQAMAAETTTKFVKFDNDPRVTPLGKFLRKTSLDELPQLFNVLKGDMSIVGNRPLPLYEAEQLTTDQWSKRFLAPAGITGLWQVSKRGKSEMSASERIQLDVDYASHHSFWTDCKIIIRTFPAIIQKESV